MLGIPAAIIGGVSAIRHGPAKNLGWAAVGIAVAQALALAAWGVYESMRASGAPLDG